MDQGRSAVRVLLSGGFISISIPVARKVGVQAALFLQHIAYWEDRSRDGWVFRTQVEIEEETFLNEKLQVKVRAKLVDMGLLIEERRGVPARMFYRIDWSVLEALMRESRFADMENLDSPNGGIKIPQNGESIKEEVIDTVIDSVVDSCESPKKRAKPRNLIPIDFSPSEEMIEAAIKRHRIDRSVIESETESFRDFHAAKGSLMLDWNAAWRTWMNNYHKFPARGGGGAYQSKADRYQKSADFFERVGRGEA